MIKKLCFLSGLLAVFLFSIAGAQVRRTAFQPRGPEVLMGALEPALRKWYKPQELYQLFGWQQWKYTNYAKDTYKRYVALGLEGYRYYDIYGRYITRGWKIYDWSQYMPRDFGSSIFKSPKYKSWFDNVLVSATSRGQYYTALTISDALRTTFTPLTFSKPTFNGTQLDFLSDKWAATVITSRVSNPGYALSSDVSPPITQTSFTNLVGLRGVAQVGRFAKLGATYVNAHTGRSLMDWADYSLKGRLTTAQNATRVRRITIRLSDDSPEDGEAGAMLFSEKIFIDGHDASEQIRPVIKGGIYRNGRYEANGNETIYLVYDISGYSYVDQRGRPRDVSWFKDVEFELILANDYKVEITSNTQVDEKGKEIFLTVARAPGNVKDATNQRVLRFKYGLPTANQIYGVTLEVTDLAGFSLRGEYDINTRYRRFPNPNPEIKEHTLASERSKAWYVTAQQLSYPWYMYGEAFNIDPDYSTMMYISDPAGRIYYDNKYRHWFEFVDDNDDQDRWPDWNRKGANQALNNDKARGIQAVGGGIFPGLDENNDLVCDYNQNRNFQPDYEEPFLRHTVDPPEYLFGMDMNNNTVIDRFENDEEADLPFPKDRRGYNAYFGAEVLRGVKLTLGHLKEWTLARDKSSTATYGLLTVDKDFPGIGRFRVFDNYKVVKDDIPEDLVQWKMVPGTIGGMVPFEDPLIYQDTQTNTAYLDFDYKGIDKLGFVNKVKYQFNRQRKSQPRLRDYSDLLGIISRADYIFEFKDYTLTPRIKGMFLGERPAQSKKSRKKDLWIIPSVLANFPVFKYGVLELGLEYTEYRDLADRPGVEDFSELIYAMQFSNESDYMGYRLTSKVGYRQSIRYLEEVTKTSSTIFVRVYAGVE